VLGKSPQARQPGKNPWTPAVMWDECQAMFKVPSSNNCWARLNQDDDTNLNFYIDLCHE
jgi:hypothetical protein